MLSSWVDTLRQVRWESPWALVLLPLMLFAWIVLARMSRRAPRGGVSSVSLLEGLPRTLRQRLTWVPATACWLGLAFLVLALARPQLGVGRVETSADAIAIQLVVDRSGSMNQYMESGGTLRSRIDSVKDVLRGFLLGDGEDLKGRPGDLIGLITFARFAETACPIVRDPQTLSQLVETVQTAQARYEDGTAIGDGLALGAARLKRAEDELKNRKLAGATGADLNIKSKIIILLTDGDNNAGDADPLEAARLAAEWGIKVYTIGVGAGGTSFQIIRSPFGGADQRVAVPSNVDETSLQKIAEITGGTYHRAQDAEALRRVYAEIDRLEKSSVNTVEYTDWQEQFATPGFAGAAFLACGLLLGSTWLRRTI
jgi:Ca-activated chloride channel family protein